MVVVTDAGEVRFGAQTYFDSFSNLPLSGGGGLRVIDVTVPGRGFVARDGARFKILCTYDGASNTTKIYINDKLRGIADPYVMGQFNFQPFYNVSGNLHEKITLGDCVHNQVLRYGETMSDIQQMYGLYQNTPITRDGTLPAAGQYATYDASRVLGGSRPLQFFLRWTGTIDEVYVYFDNGLQQGIRYPSTCAHAAPLEPESDDDVNP